MTLTDNLGLCTWVESDPVSLTQMNENFTKLDAAGGKAFFRADAANINLAGLLLHSHHAGEDVSFAQNVFLGDLTQVADAAQYENICFSSAGAHILSTGYSGETIDVKNTGITVSSSTSPKKIITFHPSGYGDLTSITIGLDSSILAAFTSYLTLRCGGQQVAQSADYVKSDTSSANTFTYTFQNTLLDPNCSYDLYFHTNYANSRTLASVTITASPRIFDSGWLNSLPVELPAGCERVHLNVYAAGAPAGVAYRENGGTWRASSPYYSRTAKSQTGMTCELRSHTFAVTEEAELELRFTLPAATSVVYGFSAAIL